MAHLRNFKRRGALILLLTAVGLLSACSGLGPIGTPAEKVPEKKPEEQTQPVPPTSVQKRIGTMGGSVTFNAAKLTVPAGAATDDTYITIATPNESYENIIQDSPYLFSPETLELKSDAVVEIGFDRDKLPEGVKPQDLVMVHLARGIFWEVPTSAVDTDKDVVRAAVSGLGVYALQVKEQSKADFNEPPVAKMRFSLSAKTDKTKGITVDFTGKDSSDPDDSIARYEWDFDGDGVFDATSSMPEATYTYTKSGVYTAVLRVTDASLHPAYGYDSAVINVDKGDVDGSQPMTVSVTMYPPDGPSPLTVYLATSVTGGQPPYTYKWDFGGADTSDVANPTRTYVDQGNFGAHLTVTDFNGVTVGKHLAWRVKGTSTLVNQASPFRIKLDASTTTITPPATVSYEIKPIGGAKPISYQIIFGEDASHPFNTTDTTFSRDYKTEGFYLAKVIATDSLRNVASAFTLVTAKSNKLPSDFDFTDGRVDVTATGYRQNLTVATKYDSHNPTSVTFGLDEIRPTGAPRFTWDFGDGQQSTDAHPVHYFERPGVYKVGVTLADDVQQQTTTMWLPVADNKLLAAIQKPNPTIGIAPYTIQFSALATNALPPLKYDWSFGGDGTDFVPAPIHTFQKEGTYDIALTVTDAKGNTYDCDPVKVIVKPKPKTFAYPITYLQKQEKATDLNIVDFDSTGQYTLATDAATLNKPVLSKDGSFVAYLDGKSLTVKHIKSGKTAFTYAPAQSDVVAYAVSAGADFVFFTVSNGKGPRSTVYSQRFGFADLGAMTVLDCSTDGRRVLLSGGKLAVADFDDKADSFGKPSDVYEAVKEGRMSADGKTAIAIDASNRVVHVNAAANKSDFISTTEGEKSSLSASRDTSVIVYLEAASDGNHIMVARNDELGKLVVKDYTKALHVTTDDVKVSPDGRLLLYYGATTVTTPGRPQPKTGAVPPEKNELPTPSAKPPEISAGETGKPPAPPRAKSPAVKKPSLYKKITAEAPKAEGPKPEAKGEQKQPEEERVSGIFIVPLEEGAKPTFLTEALPGFYVGASSEKFDVTWPTEKAAKKQ